MVFRRVSIRVVLQCLRSDYWRLCTRFPCFTVFDDAACEPYGVAVAVVDRGDGFCGNGQHDAAFLDRRKIPTNPADPHDRSDRCRVELRAGLRENEAMSYSPRASETPRFPCGIR